jgi:hypothetical protein
MEISRYCWRLVEMKLGDCFGPRSFDCSGRLAMTSEVKGEEYKGEGYYLPFGQFKTSALPQWNCLGLPGALRLQDAYR